MVYLGKRFKMEVAQLKTQVGPLPFCNSIPILADNDLKANKIG